MSAVRRRATGCCRNSHARSVMAAKTRVAWHEETEASMKFMNNKLAWFLLPVLVLLLPGCGKPQDFAEADNRRLLALPTATAAAIKNDEAAIYVTRVAPARAEADAKSIVARTEQQIAEDKHQQQLRHYLEMMALTISGTLKLNTIETQHTAEMASIQTNSIKQQMDATAAAEERAAQARIQSAVSLGTALFLLIAAVGSALALNKLLDNRATVVDRAPDGSIKAIIKHGQIVYDSALAAGPLTATAGPTGLERLLLLLVMLRQIGRDHTSPWQVYREYKLLVTPTLAHPLPTSEEASVEIALGAQQARVDAIVAKHQPAQVPITRGRRSAAAELPSAVGLTHPAFQQPLPKLEVLDAIDADTKRTLELVTGQA